VINQELAQLSNLLVYASMAAYSFAMIGFAFSFAQSRSIEDEIVSGRKAGNIAMSLSWLGTFMLAGGVISRGIAASRPPWGNMYEFSTAATFAVMLVFLVTSLRRNVRWLGLFIVTPSLLSLGLAITILYTETADLVPALKSYWLVIHVTAAIICAGLFILGSVLVTLQLIVNKAERITAAGGNAGNYAWIQKRVPDSKTLDLFAYRVHAFAFPLWTFAVVAGAIWARSAWGRYWGWDPKETWAFITWVGYAAYLHARVTVGWKGNKAAWLALFAFFTFIFNYFLVNFFFEGLHSYSGT
jgi:cytochrome c-type biogenesis protein CcsB